MYVNNENNTTYFTIMIVFITDGIYNTFFLLTYEITCKTN